uniref:Uncharacterized protein n=1 Tax=Oryza punctata TaxID=4537 RepID=A0A0E0JXT9_ORYPU
MRRGSVQKLPSLPRNEASKAFISIYSVLKVSDDKFSKAKPVGMLLLMIDTKLLSVVLCCSQHLFVHGIGAKYQRMFKKRNGKNKQRNEDLWDKQNKLSMSTRYLFYASEKNIIREWINHTPMIVNESLQLHVLSFHHHKTKEARP